MPQSLMMEERRKPARDVTPDYEDSGIFRSQLIQITVDLVPVFAMSSRLDLMIKGFVGRDGAIDVVFPGRRKAEAKPLISRLQALSYQPRSPKASDDGAHDGNTPRLSVRIEGNWRPRFRCDDQGWQTHEHQLYAARWLMKGKDGQTGVYGEMPLKGQN